LIDANTKQIVNRLLLRT